MKAATVLLLLVALALCIPCSAYADCGPGGCGLRGTYNGPSLRRRAERVANRRQANGGIRLRNLLPRNWGT